MGGHMLRRWRWAFVVAAAVSLVALRIPGEAKSARHSYRSHSSYSSHSSGHSYSHTYRSSALSSHSSASRLSGSRHSVRSATSYRTPRKPSVYRVAARRRTSTRSAYYKSGIPKHRSEEAKKQFLRQHGLKRVPPGMQVDHVVPLSEGGADKPSNMELLSKSAHAAKTAAEAKRYGWHKKR